MGAENSCRGVFFPTSPSRPHPGPAGGSEKTEEVGIWAKEGEGKKGNFKSSNWERIPIANSRVRGRSVWPLMHVCVGWTMVGGERWLSDLGN